MDSLKQSNLSFPFLQTAIVLLLLSLGGSLALPEIRCGYVVMITKAGEIHQQQGRATIARPGDCTIVEGHVIISMITNLNYTDEDFVVFKNLREITGYLVVFNVRGLTSLGRIFPNLRVIGGNSLVMNYALIVYHNPDLKEIGLHKLTTIRNGGVRITENRHLCYTNSIDWMQIMVGKPNDQLVDPYNLDDYCHEKCTPNATDQCVRNNGQLRCWDREHCQIECPHAFENGTSGPGCDAEGHACHPQCVGGCLHPDDPSACFSCRHVEHDGKCVESCPAGLFNLMQIRCVTAQQCRELPTSTIDGNAEGIKLKPFDGVCHYQCPEGYQQGADEHTCVSCNGYCPKRCKVMDEEAVIDTESAALEFRGCNIVEGNLQVFTLLLFAVSFFQIEAQSLDAGKLALAFGEIEEIEGYMVVRFSPNIVSLHMFKKLRKIHGNVLYRQRYALVVFENANLHEIFDLRRVNLTIVAGTVQFQNNPMLCYDKIVAFVSHIGRNMEPNNGGKGDERNANMSVTDLDVSPHSNGDKAICSHVPFEITVKVDPENKLLINWKPFDTADMDHRKFLGYQVFYKEVSSPHLKISIYENRTTKLINHPGARNAISNITFFRTLFAKPEPPRITSVDESFPDSITLKWEAPVKSNGQITHYIVKWKARLEDVEALRHEHRQQGGKCTSMDVKDKEKTNPFESLVGYKPFEENVRERKCSSVVGCCVCAAGTSAAPGEKKQEVQEARSTRQRRAIRDSLSMDPTKGSDEIASTADTAHIRNVTGLNFTITGLRHFTEYIIFISACQNTSAPQSFCSKYMETVARTASIDSKDLIDPSSVKVFNGSAKHNDRNITWTDPVDPNGVVLAYSVNLLNTRTNLSSYACADYQRFKHSKGFSFHGLTDGSYRIEIRTVSLAGVSKPVVIDDFFSIHTPPLFTWPVIAGLTGTLFVVLAVSGMLVYWGMQRHFGKKVREYMHQVISANPEYLSQLDVYKADEWELKRGDLQLEEEIGRGTFGKVFRGVGKNVKSQCGVIFGPCAIKTVAENANPGERLHFLIEASVMKQFNTAFIVKLYGVVSDGQPVLVAMELMQKGNLRDYLRSRRPDAEENTEHLPPPSSAEIFRWAAEIADGMAYLESLKFCHRDLAARNCMVSADTTVKIGDFGMARDIYYHEYYKPSGKRLMPVRWMAPESLKDGKFTMKSDVWSYGVVLYEMMTLAAQPYAGLPNDEVFTFITVTRRWLLKPTDCPDFWYDLMVKCWKYDPRERPSFAELVLYLLPQTSEQFRNVSFVVSNREAATAPDAVRGGGVGDDAFLSDDISLVNEDERGDNSRQSSICNSNRRNPASWKKSPTIEAHDDDSL